MTNNARTEAIIRDLLDSGLETPHAEFKKNNSNPEAVAKYISAMANSACLADVSAGYVLWGVQDQPRELVGTTFDPSTPVNKSADLGFRVSQLLRHAPDYSFDVCAIDGQRVVLLTIPPASTFPVEAKVSGVFQARIRIESATPALSEYPERQRALWAKLDKSVWESGTARGFVPAADVLKLLDYEAYFRLTNQPVAQSTPDVLARMESDKLIRKDVGDHYDVLNLGAILFAHRLSDVSESLARKAVRFVRYDGTSRSNTVTRRQDGGRGYASSISGLVDFLNTLLPINEHVSGAFRTERKLFPEVAIRELIANALIHQDMSQTGAGPLVELFSDRIEISNPGQALIPTDRFLDHTPQSRNERLAGLMRRMNLCEESGIGIDRVIEAVELYQSPPPDFRQEVSAVKAILYAPRGFSEMTPDERVRACFQHAGLEYLSSRRMTNASLRKRFGLDDSKSASSQVSKVIRASREEGLIRQEDGGGPRSYIPVFDRTKG